MTKRLSVYFLCFWISFFPVYQAHAFLPAVAVGLGSNAVRFLASEIALDVIARGFAANDPLYQSQGKLSKSKYLSFLKGKGKLVPFIASGLAAAGFLIVGDEILTNPEVTPTPEGDVSPEKGFYWFLGEYVASTPLQVANMDCASFSSSSVSCVGVLPVSITSNSAEYRRQLSNGQTSIVSIYVSRSSCSSSSSSVSTCQPDYEPENPSQRPATDKEIETDFYAWVSSQPEHDQKFAFSDSNGVLHPDLKPDIQLPPPPTMPDGRPIPGVGDQLWIYADWISRGLGQNADPTVDHYIPPQYWDDAYYLAHTVAGGNSAITSANANGTGIPNPNPDGNTKPDGNWSASNPLPVIGPMTFEEYYTYTDANLAQASSSIGDGDLTSSKNEITTAMNDFINNSVSVDVPEWEFNPFGYLSYGGGQCLPFTVRLSIGDIDTDVIFDSHCAPYEEFVRPTLEWSLYLLTALNIYMIFTRTVRSL
ncbi:hypothetical protein [Vibrio cholerae]|uniref:hypothetical protein n=1 Tax=Vibrio cholerae TaxID=666 RepID=UPI002FDC7915